MNKELAMKLAEQAYNASTNFADAHLRKRWEASFRQFQGKHPRGSKYLSDSYKHRSRVFRPKSRALVNQSEAACAQAFFSTARILDIEPEDDNNPMQRASADIMQEILQHRLTKTIPWFLVLNGAWQDAQVQGVVVSKNTWRYAERTKTVSEPMRLEGNPVIDEDGEEVMYQREETEVVEDRPWIEVIPVENFRIDPSADWLDPINTSPYLIELMPMYRCDIKARMRAEDPKTGEPKWIKYEDKELNAGHKPTMDTTRSQRYDQTDTDQVADSAGPNGEYDIIWVHYNIVKDAMGEDWCFYTIGTDHLLSKPQRLREKYLHGQRPYTFGWSTMETHKVFPASRLEQVSGLQKEANEIANLRLDNVKLALSKRRYVRHGSVMDFNSLRRLIPGGITPIRGDPNRDISWEDTPDVTASAYQEQNMLNLDFDELGGQFSSATAQSNRRLNETVGGLNLLASGSSQVTEYSLRIFTETWVENTLRQLVKLIQAYETDDVVLSLAADKAKLYQRYGIDEVTDRLLNQQLTLAVNVGISATNPMMKLQRFAFSAEIMSRIFGPEMLAKIMNPKEVIPEIFGNSGYKDGKRFFYDMEGEGDPRLRQAMEMIQQLQQALETKQVEEQARNERMTNLEMMKSQTKLLDTQISGEYDIQTALISANSKLQGDKRRGSD